MKENRQWAICPMQIFISWHIRPKYWLRHTASEHMWTYTQSRRLHIQDQPLSKQPQQPRLEELKQETVLKKWCRANRGLFSQTVSGVSGVLRPFFLSRKMGRFHGEPSCLYGWWVSYVPQKVRPKSSDSFSTNILSAELYELCELYCASQALPYGLDLLHDSTRVKKSYCTADKYNWLWFNYEAIMIEKQKVVEF